MTKYIAISLEIIVQKVTGSAVDFFNLDDISKVRVLRYINLYNIGLKIFEAKWYDVITKKFYAKEYIIDMGEKLKTIVPDIQYAPKIDGSIFRIHKDVRINKGKPPFKTHLGIIFWHGASRLENPCFYLHIEPPFYYTGVGIARFSPEILYSYRLMVNSKKY